MVKQAFADYKIFFNTIAGTGIFQQGGADPGGTLEDFFTILLGTFTVLGGIAFLIYILLGAFAWLTSQGDKEKVAKAQRYISNAVIGLIVIVLAWAITGIIGLMLDFDILNLEELIGNLNP